MNIGLMIYLIIGTVVSYYYLTIIFPKKISDPDLEIPIFIRVCFEDSKFLAFIFLIGVVTWFPILIIKVFQKIFN